MTPRFPMCPDCKIVLMKVSLKEHKPNKDEPCINLKWWRSEAFRNKGIETNQLMFNF